MRSETPDVDAVLAYLRDLQGRICSALEDADGAGQFGRDNWTRDEGGGGESRVLRNGKVFEQAGVNFSHVSGNALPASATAQRPELSNAPWVALGVSLVIHPWNPYVPTTHANVRFFSAATASGPVWWFGGGFDLTPFYPFDEDVLHWHETAYQACAPFGPDVYVKHKQWCDRYFYLKHRNETRGIGGLFFDDLNEWGFSRCFDRPRDRDAIRRADIVHRAKKQHHEETAEHQRAVDLWDVDLSRLLLGGVHDRDARPIAQLHELLRE